MSGVLTSRVRRYQTLYDIFKKINNGDYPPLPDVFSQVCCRIGLRARYGMPGTDVGSMHWLRERRY
eukprot:2773395-Rhodomonas_salina.2